MVSVYHSFKNPLRTFFNDIFFPNFLRTSQAYILLILKYYTQNIYHIKSIFFSLRNIYIDEASPINSTDKHTIGSSHGNPVNR